MGAWMERRGNGIRKREDLPECPVAAAVQRMGSKWKLLILLNLMQRSCQKKYRA